MPIVSMSKLYLLREQLTLASFQLSELREDGGHEDVQFAKDNIEAALEIVVSYIRTEEYDPLF